MNKSWGEVFPIPALSVFRERLIPFGARKPLVLAERGKALGLTFARELETLPVRADPLGGAPNLTAAKRVRRQVTIERLMNKQTTTSTWSALSHIKTSFTAGLLPVIVLLLSLQPTQAGSANSNFNPASSDWNTAANWTPATVPNGPADTAQFAVSNTTGISISSPTEVSGIQFNPGASAFTITAPPMLTLTISGVGITNNSGTTQNIVTTVDGAGNHGSINFSNSATAGNATLIANGGTGGGAGGLMQFSANSSGGTARVEVFGNGNLDISAHNAPGVSIGSIEGSGIVFLGARNLTLGSNNLSTTFSGVIQDGGTAGGAGGSLTKIGSGKLTLSGANTYTGAPSLAPQSTVHYLLRIGEGLAQAAAPCRLTSASSGARAKYPGAYLSGRKRTGSISDTRGSTLLPRDSYDPEEADVQSGRDLSLRVQEQ